MHLDGIDQPIGLIRPEGTRVLNYTWRGLGESSVFTNGNSGDCSMFFTGCAPVQWPGKTQAGVYFTRNLLASGPSGPYTWFGTLAENGGGSTGMLFRRNRYFDPVSGRFTQQDPIGVAGGLNLYGFADGDPVNFSDPLGLCPLCQVVTWWLSRGGPALAGLGAASTGLSSRLAPGGGLMAHEARGGHTIERHVARSIVDLSSRLKAQSRIDAASSFVSRAAAESGVAGAIEQKGGDIARWLAGTESRLSFSASLKEGLGYVLERGKQYVEPATGVRIILDRAPGTELGYLIRTAYPTTK